MADKPKARTNAGSSGKAHSVVKPVALPNSKLKPEGKLMTETERKDSSNEKSSGVKTPAKMTIRSSGKSAGQQVIKRIITPAASRGPVKRTPRSNQFTYMKAPGLEHAFEVGDTVEVFCDHEKSRERIRGWVKGIVVQVDLKLVAVQFRSNVYLTDGWMVPDRILWYPLTSEHIRPVGSKKTFKEKKNIIPDY